MTLVVLAVLAFACTMTTNAEETGFTTLLLTREDKGILGTMQRGGCAAPWLPTVMKKSGILESELNRLPIGTPVVLPEGCKTGLPSAADQATTARILARENEALAREKASIIVPAPMPQAQEESVAVSQLKSERDQSAIKLEETQRQLAELRKKTGWSGMAVLIAAVLGICFGAGLVYLAGRLWWAELNRDAVIAYRTQKLLSKNAEGEETETVYLLEAVRHTCLGSGSGCEILLPSQTVEQEHLERHAKLHANRTNNPAKKTGDHVILRVS